MPIPTPGVNGPTEGLTKFNEPRCQETHLFFGQCALAVGHEKQAFSRAHNPIDSRTSPTYTWVPRTSGPEYYPPNAEKLAVSSTYGKPVETSDFLRDFLLMLIITKVVAILKAKAETADERVTEDSPEDSPTASEDDRTMCWCGVNHGVDPPMDTEPEKPVTMLTDDPNYCQECGRIHNRYFG